MRGPYRVEKGIPLPPRRSNGKLGPRITYPLLEMDVGDSFFVPEGPEEYANRRLSAAVSNYVRHHPELKLRFVVRVVAGGQRCWRIK